MNSDFKQNNTAIFSSFSIATRRSRACPCHAGAVRPRIWSKMSNVSYHYDALQGPVILTHKISAAVAI